MKPKHTSIVILTIFAFFIIALWTRADTLLWDDDNPPGIVSHYVVQRRLPDGTWTNLATTQTNSWPILLPAGQHFVRVVAYAPDGENATSTNKAFYVLIVPRDLRIVHD